jgi:hypothetical protein
MRAFGRGVAGFENQLFKTLATRITLVLIDRHSGLPEFIWIIIMVLRTKSRPFYRAGRDHIEHLSQVPYI